MIPESVTSIEDSVFSGCTSLTSVKIPKSVTSIGMWAFKYCDKLTKIDVAPESKSYVIVDGVLFSKDKKSLVCFPAGRSDDYYEIPDGTVNIAGAFYGCKNLKAVKIPEGVTSIGERAFSGCKNLKPVVIPEGVTSIGWGAFDYCTSLTSVEIPKSVTSIGMEAFLGCKSLATVTFGDTGGWYADKELTKSVPAGQLASYMKRGGSLYKRIK